MKCYLLTLIIAFFYSAISQAQLQHKQNSLSIELGRSGLIYNLLFDHQFAPRHFGVQVMAGSNFAKYLRAAQAGGGAYYLIGKQKHYLELGAVISYLWIEEDSDDQRGFAFVYPDHQVQSIYPAMNIGYRFYKKNRLFRIGLSPGFIKSEYVPGGYISYGLSFNN